MSRRTLHYWQGTRALPYRGLTLSAGRGAYTPPLATHRTPGRAHGPCPTKRPVGRDLCVPPPITAAFPATCHCEPVTDVTGVAIRIPLRCASGGSLPFGGERKGGKNAAKTHGFGILSAAEVPSVPVPSCPANWFLQILCLAFASSLRLIPRRAPRLCWFGGTGKTSALTVRWGPLALPCKPFRRGDPCGRPSHNHRTSCKKPVIAKPVRKLAAAIRIPKKAKF